MNRKTDNAWIIDAAYLHLASRAAGLRIDMLKLKRLVEQRLSGTKQLREGYYFNSLAPDDVKVTVERFHKYLKSAEPTGPQLRVELYDTKTQDHVCPNCDTKSQRRIQQGVDVAIAMRIIMVSERCDQIVLVAGDSDFLDAVKYVKSKLHKRLILAGFRGSVSTDLQSYADEVIWLNDYEGLIRRDRLAA